ncbi:7-carboxy-7-deazaguanine synthase [Rhodovastum atsumiense]|uniref:7-carboxy-7-deazaguanine synthase n=1 Tax=Rhodovastum atsumiense TaxID=504468 RepID=A0A5M6IVD3_9PROT|nr:7-carboxy-7-deazaguanine synthase [Rhodovastum atsumiense]KAA5612273.1 7-carboxy-7-deazaguanine synthase [Rhodovastum atsumiense]
MTYIVHSIFHTLQGEGANLGRASVFIRFAGCNLWSGREEDRAAATCRFCDTEFRGGTRHATAPGLARAAARCWGAAPGHRFVVLTGGEPLLQVDAALVEALHAEGFVIAVETNGTVRPPKGIDWICVSPKAGAELVLDHADELKLVFPQPGLPPDALAGFAAAQRWLQPMDGPALAANTAAAAAYCLANPPWRLSIQAHKTWNIP